MGGGIEKARNFHAGFFMTNGCLRRDGWQWFSSMQVWEQLVNQTKRSSRDHAALAEIYSTHISQRCTNITEDIQRMHKKVCIFRLLRFHAAQVHQWIFCFLFFENSVDTLVMRSTRRFSRSCMNCTRQWRHITTINQNIDWQRPNCR